MIFVAVINMARWRKGNAAVCKTAMRGFESLPRLHPSLDVDKHQTPCQPASDPPARDWREPFVLVGLSDPLVPLDTVFGAWLALQRHAQHCADDDRGTGDTEPA